MPVGVSQFLKYVARHGLTAEGARERARSKGLLTHHSNVLLGSRYLILAKEWGREVTAFDAADRTHKVYFTVSDPEGALIGLDVDPSGQIALVAWEADGVPEIEVLNPEGEAVAVLNCDELIGARMKDLRWQEGTAKIAYLNVLTKQEGFLGVDWRKRAVRWCEGVDWKRHAVRKNKR